MINMAKKSPEDQNEIPFLEKFMVSQTYDIFRFGGEEIKNDKKQRIARAGMKLLKILEKVGEFENE